jgi:asparagine synthase (glutamine-hydrolysing)
MAQIFGLGGFDDERELRRAIGRMAAAIRRPHQPPAVLWLDPAAGVALGYIRDPGTSTDAQPARPVPCVLDGRFYRGPLVGDRAPAAALQERYAARGASMLDDLDGSFALAVYLEAERRLMVATDRFSTRALYWTERAGRLIFASELKGILAVPGVPLDLDRSALAQCAAFNRILDHRTLVRRVSRVPGGSVLEWSAHSGVRAGRYWRPNDVVAERRPLTAARRDEIVEAFRDAVSVRARDEAALGISLSGGLDSRAVAAALRAEGIRGHSCTTGFAGSADQRLAAQVAAATGMDHHFFELRKEAVADYPRALRDATFVRDELLLYGGFPARLDERFCSAFGIRTLLRGHGGENVKLAEAWPFQVTPAVLGMRQTEEIRPHLRRVLASCPADVDLDRLLPAPGGETVAQALDEAIAAAVGGYANLSPAEVMSLLYLAQNDGMDVPLTRNGLRGHADMAVPFIDYRLLDLVLATRVEDRCDTGIHIAILRTLAPVLLRIGNSNTGAPVDASRLRVFVTDKANTLLKRLGVPGFRHYHYMERWLQGFLAGEVRAIVLDERTVARGVFPRGQLDGILERARKDSGMSRLVNFVMSVEVWCRVFADREGLPEPDDEAGQANNGSA